MIGTVDNIPQDPHAGRKLTHFSLIYFYTTIYSYTTFGFLMFSGGKKWNIGTKWIKSTKINAEIEFKWVSLFNIKVDITPCV